VNPAATGWFEPGLVERFAAFMGARTAEAGVPFADLHDAAAPGQFIPVRRPDGLHLSPKGARLFAPVLAERIAARLRAVHR
jgi:lysophospholipase L1-like esterase